MSDTTATNSDAGAATSGQSTEVDTATHQQDDTESLLNQDSGAQSEHTEEENDDIEVDGKKFTLPKSAAEKLKTERMMHADYTQKTQTVAEERRQLQSEREAVTKQHQQSQQYITDVAKVVSIDEQLAAYEKVDWNGLINQDPVEALRHQNQVRQLQGQRAEALNVLAQKQQQYALSEQQSIAKQAQDAEAYFAREITGWSAARSDQLMQYGVAQGIPAQTLSRAVLNQPVLAKLLHKAEQYDQIVKKQSTATPPKPQAAPVSTVGQNASVKKDPTKMSPTEFAAYRRKVISKR